MDIAELGYKIDSSGLEAGTKALDENTAAAGRTEAAADRLDKGYQAMVRTLQQTSSALGDRLVGSMDKLIGSSGAVLSELQLLNKSQADWMAMVGQTQAALANLEGRMAGTAGAAGVLADANKQAAEAAQAAAISATKEAQAIADQDARLRAVAAAGIAYAESMSTANLSDRALAEAALLASGGLDLQAKSTLSAATEQERMVARARALEEAEARLANQAKAAAAALEAEAIDLKKLTGDIDPVVAKLNKLADAEDKLEKAANLGLIKPAQFQQLQGQIDATREKILNAGKGTDEFTGALGRLNVQSAATQRNLSQMVSYAVTGNWQLAGNQIMQMGNQAGIAGALFTSTGIAVGGFTAAVIAGLVAWKQGQDELFDFQKSLILTGQNADVSEAQFQGLVAQINSLAGVSRGEAVDALTAVAASGKLAGQNMEMIAGSAARMEAATGQSTSKTIAAFESIADSPVDALLKLNIAEGFLDRAQIARIVTLQQEGHEQAAVTEALALYGTHLDEVSNKADAVMPAVVKWWRDVKDEASNAWGEVVTFTGHLDELAATLAAKFPKAGAGIMAAVDAMLPSTQLAQLNSLFGGSKLPTPIYDPGDDKRKDVSDYTKLLQENKVAEDAASQALNARLAGLDRVSAKQAAYNKIVELYNKLPDNDPRHFDGSMDKLVAQSNTQIDKQFNQKEGLNKQNTDDNSAQTFVASINRQIEANKQLAESGKTVSASERMVIQARQLLTDKTNTMTAATRAMLEALIPTLEATDKQAKAETARQDALGKLQRLQSELNKEDQSGLALAKERQKILDGAVSAGVNVSDSDYASTAKGIIQAGYKPMKYDGPDALYGGASGELGKVNTAAKQEQDQYSQSLALLATYRASRSDLNAQWDAEELALQTQHSQNVQQLDQSRWQVQLTAAQQGLGAATDVMKTAFGEQSALYKVAFITQKAAAIAQATLAIQAGIAEAAKNPWPENLIAMASVATATASLVSNISAVGMAHDGINSVPADGTWLLQKGERVMTAQTSAALDATLAAVRSGQGSGGGNTYAPQIYVSGDPDAKTLAALNSMLDQHGRKFSQQTYDRVASDLATGRGKVVKGLVGGNNVSRRLK